MNRDKTLEIWSKKIEWKGKYGEILGHKIEKIRRESIHISQPLQSIKIHKTSANDLWSLVNLWWGVAIPTKLAHKNAACDQLQAVSHWALKSHYQVAKTITNPASFSGFL